MNKTELYKQAALTISNTICRDAIWHGPRCNWISTATEDWFGNPRAYAKTLSTTFYDGTSGVAFFLLQMWRAQPSPLLHKTLLGALEQIISIECANEKKEAGESILGFYVGLAGCAYVLHLAGEQLGEERYKAAATQLIEKMIGLPEEAWGIDVIDGPAGAIPVLIYLHQKQPSDSLRQFILKLGDYLIQKADKAPNGWSWNTVPERHFNLTGYGHGAAGFATAFSELFAFTGDQQYQQIAQSVVQYENSHFVPQQQNWPDYRKFDQGYAMETTITEPACSVAWCHGAPGIGISRVRMFSLTNNPLLKQDAEVAIQTTLKNLQLTTLGNYSMCHGVFGNAELLLYAARVFNQPHLRQKAEQLADECLEEFLNKKIPVPNGLQQAAETPDFMLGNSGIGYFYLRLTDPVKFPSMLLFGV